MEAAYARLIGGMVRRSAVMIAIALALIGAGAWGIARLPAGFLPAEDQGYVIVAVQLPDGASLERTQAVLDRVHEIAAGTPGVQRVIGIAGISVLDNSASLANAGVAYVKLKDWSARGAGEDLRSIYLRLLGGLDGVKEAQSIVLIPPSIQGIGNASGVTMMVELRDGSFDFAKLEALSRAIVADAGTQTGLARVQTTFRARTPQLSVEVNRTKAEELQVTVGQVFQVMAAYLGSQYVGQITKFGRVFQIYVQADAAARLKPSDIEGLYVRNQAGDMVPLGTLLRVTPTVGPALISLYNLYPAATIVGSPAPGFSSDQALALMEQIAERALPRGTGFEWTAMSYQEKVVGSQIYFVFGFAVLLVYLVLAGQYESWTAPLSVILAVPLALLGPVIALSILGLDNNLYTQIGLILLIALAAKNAILIVEVAREERHAGKPLFESAVDAARARFRPILMTSFAFILGVVPLVLATGAGANARRSIGIAVFSGMLASTCLAVLLVPSFFVVVQRYEDWRAARKQRRAVPTVVPIAEEQPTMSTRDGSVSTRAKPDGVR
jgi:HAE1 family hydrophobic/amphiphilic exporter-1